MRDIISLFFSSLSSFEILLIASILFLFFVVVVLLIVVMRSTKKVNDLTYPIYEYVIKRAEGKAQDITNSALKRSKELIAVAEIEGKKVLVQEKLESAKIEKSYEDKLKELTEQTKSLLNEYATEAEQNAALTKELLETYAHEAEESLRTLTESLEKSVSGGISENERVIKEESVRISKQMSSTFEALEKRFKEQIDQNLKKEFASAKEMVKSYRKQQLDLVDAYIVSLVERTAAIVFQEKLLLKDHADLALRALEEAKSEGVFK